MNSSEINHSSIQKQNLWPIAHDFRDLYKTTEDIDAHAKAYFNEFPGHPPDGFDVIDWDKYKRRRERSSYDWNRVFEACELSFGFMNRLETQLPSPVFLTIRLVDIGFSCDFADPQHYHSRKLVKAIVETLKKRIKGVFWWRIEVGIKGFIHVHVICNEDAYRIRAFVKPVTDFKGLYWYLIKKIPYNAVNLAAFWKAKTFLATEGKKKLVKKSSTARLKRY